MQSICVLFLLLYTVLSSAEVNNLLVPSGVITTIADQSEEAAEVEDCLNGKRDRPLPPATCSIVQQCPQPPPPTSSTQTTTLSSFGIEPGVCLKNVAAIITQQQHHQTVITSAAPNPTKELPSEVIAGTKEKPDFHFDKHSQFTGIFYFFPPTQNKIIMNIWFPSHPPTHYTPYCAHFHSGMNIRYTGGSRWISHFWIKIRIEVINVVKINLTLSYTAIEVFATNCDSKCFD